MESAGPFFKERLNLSDFHIFVADNDTRKLAGFTQLYPLFSSLKMKKLWLLKDLFVNPNFRQKGISIGLIKEQKGCL
jgi:hypothetical protein